MSSPLEQAEALVTHLRAQAELEQALLDAGQAHEANPSPEALRAHDQAAVALTEHRAKVRAVGSMKITAEQNTATTETEEG